VNDLAAGSPREERLLAFDALRAGAMLLGVAFHASVAYSVRPLPELLWPVADEATTRLCDILFWWSHAFRMPLFFLVAGYFAERTTARSGAVALVASRARRVLLPLAAAGLAVLPVVYYVWAAGWWIEGRVTVKEIRAVKFADPAIQAGFLGPAHLWFLGDLFLLVVLFALLRPSLPKRPAAALALPVAGVALLAFVPEVFTGFRNSLVPDPSRLAWGATFFLAGATLRRAPRALDALERHAPALLLLSLPAGGAAFLAATRRAPSSPHLGARAAFAAAVALLAWLTVLGLVGLARRVPWSPQGRWRALAGTSYWIYLVHLPLVGAAQLLLAPLPLPAAVKLLLVTAAATGLAFATGRPLVLDGRLRRWLGPADARVEP
jgi:peptidoglycan/LPS O-acetylase OafA/YrhL